MSTLPRFKAQSVAGWSLDVRARAGDPFLANGVILSTTAGPLGFSYDMTSERARELAQHLVACADALEPVPERGQPVTAGCVALVASLRELIDLCAIGDVDESTEAYGWGEAIKRAKAAIDGAGR